MSLLSDLEAVERRKQAAFTTKHHRPGLLGFFQQCLKPDVIPDSEKTGRGGVGVRIDICQTCGQTYKSVTGFGVVHSGW